MAKLTLPSGHIVEGTVAEIQEIISRDEKLRGGYHWSESKQAFIKVTEMATPHLRNVIVKKYRNWLEGVGEQKTPKDIIEALNAFDPFNDPDVKLVIGELIARYKAGTL